MTLNKEQTNKDKTKLQDVNSEKVVNDNNSVEIEDNYKFGWSRYSEITNGRFAMLGFLAIILIEIISKQPFWKWAGIF